MAHSDFPSGPWTGFYQYSNGERGHQDLRLMFDKGRLTGSGSDELGVFNVEGSYDESSKEASWSKLYPDGHSVAYRGFREGPVPGIWGTWQIQGNSTGGFHIWPLGESDTEKEEDVTAESEPAERRRLLRELVEAMIRKA